MRLLVVIAAIVAGLAAILLTGCDVPEPRWKTEWNGYEPLAGYECLLDTAHRHAPCRLVQWSGQVGWYPCPFTCAGAGLVWGCMPDGVTLPTFAVCYRSPVWTTALAHELGHYVLSECGLDSTDEARVEAWAVGVNLEAEANCAGGVP